MLLRAAPALLARSGIRPVTVARALGLTQSEVSLWLRRRDPPLRITGRGMRYITFLAGLRRAEINQAAAAVLLADNEACGRPEVWQRASERAGEVGAARGCGLRGVLRDDMQGADPVDPARVGVAPGPHRRRRRVQRPGSCPLQRG